MAAYRRVYDSRHLQADCQEPVIEYGLPLPCLVRWQRSRLLQLGSMSTAVVSRRLSVSSIASASSLTSAPGGHDDDDDASSRSRRAHHRCKSIIPGVLCWPGSDWTSARDRRVHRCLLIALPSLPLLVAALVSTACLQRRYDIPLHADVDVE